MNSPKLRINNTDDGNSTDNNKPITNAHRKHPSDEPLIRANTTIERDQATVNGRRSESYLNKDYQTNNPTTKSSSSDSNLNKNDIFDTTIKCRYKNIGCQRTFSAQKYESLHFSSCKMRHHAVAPNTTATDTAVSPDNESKRIHSKLLIL